MHVIIEDYRTIQKFFFSFEGGFVVINNKGKKRKGGAVGREAMLPFLFLVLPSNPEFKNASNDDNTSSKNNFITVCIFKEQNNYDIL